MAVFRKLNVYLHIFVHLIFAVKLICLTANNSQTMVCDLQTGRTTKTEKAKDRCSFRRTLCPAENEATKKRTVLPCTMLPMDALLLLFFSSSPPPHNSFSFSQLAEHYPLTASVMHWFRLCARKLDNVAFSSVYTPAAEDKVREEDEGRGKRDRERRVGESGKKKMKIEKEGPQYLHLSCHV